MEDIKWIKVHECLNRERAYLMKAYLESRGIPVVLQGIEEESILPGISYGRIPLLVREEDRSKAESLIEEFFKETGDEH